MNICIVIFLLVGACLSQVPVLTTEPRSDLTTAESTYFSPFDAAGDVALIFNNVAKNMVVMTRDAAGFFSVTADINLGADVALASTNGAWHLVGSSTRVYPFQVDAEGSLVHFSPIDIPFTFKFYKMLSDNSIVVVAHEGNRIQTYTTEDGIDWILLHDQTFADLTFLAMYAGAPHMTDTHFACHGRVSEIYVGVHLFVRAEDLSWELVDTVIVTSAGFGSLNTLLWDGVDTIITTGPTYSQGGIVAIYTKANDVWTAVNTFGDSYGVSYHGLGLLMIDQTMFLAGNLADSPLLFRRNGNEWMNVGKLAPENATDLFYGANYAQNGDEILIYVCTNNVAECFVHALPKCNLEPTEVTCQSVDLEDCSDIPYESYVTITTPSSCGETTLSIVDQGETSTGYYATVQAQRAVVAEQYCNVTVTCPAAPVAAPLSAPGTSSPVTDSPASNSPSQTPSAAPKSATSGASALKLVGLTSLAIVAILL